MLILLLQPLEHGDYRIDCIMLCRIIILTLIPEQQQQQKYPENLSNLFNCVASKWRSWGTQTPDGPPVFHSAAGRNPEVSMCSLVVGGWEWPTVVLWKAVDTGGPISGCQSWRWMWKSFWLTESRGHPGLPLGDSQWSVEPGWKLVNPHLQIPFHRSGQHGLRLLGAVPCPLG